jgi:hypothetical protein
MGKHLENADAILRSIFLKKKLPWSSILNVLKYESCTTNFDTLYRELLIPFLIKFDVFVNVNTHTHIGALGIVVDKALFYQPERHGFETRWNE